MKEDAAMELGRAMYLANGLALGLAYGCGKDLPEMYVAIKTVIEAARTRGSTIELLSRTRTECERLIELAQKADTLPNE